LQNLPLESSCVVVTLIENYSTSKPFKVSPEKSQILSCDAVELSQMSDTASNGRNNELGMDSEYKRVQTEAVLAKSEERPWHVNVQGS
jgi:hypothetical protein